MHGGRHYMTAPDEREEGEEEEWRGEGGSKRGEVII